MSKKEYIYALIEFSKNPKDFATYKKIFVLVAGLLGFVMCVLLMNLSQMQKFKGGKVHFFLKNLENLLLNTNNNKISNFILIEGKSCYYSVFDKSYTLYDSKEFDSIMQHVYYNSVVSPVISNNEFYFRLNYCLNLLLNLHNYKYYAGIFNNYNFLSWFFKCLRFSQINYNEFNLYAMKKNFPMFYLADVSRAEHLEFFLKFIDSLLEKRIFNLNNEVLRFELESDIESSQELINFSFEHLSFGYSTLYSNKFTNSDFDFNFVITEKKINFLEDYKFNYILANTTNCVNFDINSNNLYLDHSLEDIKKCL